MPVKKLQAANEYKAAATATPDEALHDYCNLSTVFQGSAPYTFKKSIADYATLPATNSTPIYIFNDGLQDAGLFFLWYHAKTFKAKLIFPQHYYW